MHVAWYISCSLLIGVSPNVIDGIYIGEAFIGESPSRHAKWTSGAVNVDQKWRRSFSKVDQKCEWGKLLEVGDFPSIVTTHDYSEREPCRCQILQLQTFAPEHV